MGGIAVRAFLITDTDYSRDILTGELKLLQIFIELLLWEVVSNIQLYPVETFLFVMLFQSRLLDIHRYMSKKELSRYFGTDEHDKGIFEGM